jgi:hypothetical protein
MQDFRVDPDMGQLDGREDDDDQDDDGTLGEEDREEQRSVSVVVL